MNTDGVSTTAQVKELRAMKGNRYVRKLDTLTLTEISTFPQITQFLYNIFSGYCEFP